MHITMASLHKPKGHDAPDRKHPAGVTPADATAETPPAPDTKTAVPQPAAVAQPTAAAATPEPVQAGE
jgi:hypothetical protein